MCLRPSLTRAAPLIMPGPRSAAHVDASAITTITALPVPVTRLTCMNMPVPLDAILVRVTNGTRSGPRPRARPTLRPHSPPFSLRPPGPRTRLSKQGTSCIPARPPRRLPRAPSTLGLSAAALPLVGTISPAHRVPRLSLRPTRAAVLETRTPRTSPRPSSAPAVMVPVLSTTQGKIRSDPPYWPGPALLAPTPGHTSPLVWPPLSLVRVPASLPVSRSCAVPLRRLLDLPAHP